MGLLQHGQHLTTYVTAVDSFGEHKQAEAAGSYLCTWTLWEVLPKEAGCRNVPRIWPFECTRGVTTADRRDGCVIRAETALVAGSRVQMKRDNRQRNPQRAGDSAQQAQVKLYQCRLAAATLACFMAYNRVSHGHSSHQSNHLQMTCCLPSCRNSCILAAASTFATSTAVNASRNALCSWSVTGVSERF